MPWVFRTYQRASGRDDVRKWYEDLARRDRVTVLSTLQYLRDQPREKWARPLGFAPLHGLDGMGEFLFKFGGVQNRLIGFFGPYRMSYTILLPVLKKGRSFDPREWEETALRRKAEVESDSGCTHVWLS
jgi:hypothetical protein